MGCSFRHLSLENSAPDVTLARFILNSFLELHLLSDQLLFSVVETPEANWLLEVRQEVEARLGNRGWVFSVL
jgi:hypothetical protein